MFFSPIDPCAGKGNHQAWRHRIVTFSWYVSGGGIPESRKLVRNVFIRADA